MTAQRSIQPPRGANDTQGARRVFEDFLDIYQPTLVRVENYLEDTVRKIDPAFAEAYRPWQQALHDRLQYWSDLEHQFQHRQLKVWFLKWRVLAISLECADVMSRGHSLRSCFSKWLAAVNSARLNRRALIHRRRSLQQHSLSHWRRQLQRVISLRYLLSHSEDRSVALRLRRTFVKWRSTYRAQLTDRRLSSLVTYYVKQHRILPRLRAWVRVTQQWAPLRKLETEIVRPTRVRLGPSMLFVLCLI